MANRFPLILDTADSNKLKELPNGDNLDLTGSGISAVGDIQSTGTTTAKAVKLSGYTTAERDALGAVEGQMIYNSSTDTFQGYMGSSWQSFSSGFATSDLSVVTSTPTGGGALSYNSTSGTFTFSPAATAAQNLSLSQDDLSISGGNTISLASLPIAYTNITGKPTTLSGYGITNGQETLISGTNIKTINGFSILGNGDIQIQGGGGGGSGAPMNFSVGADDSTLRQINTGESIRFIGGDHITTASDTEGNITVNFSSSGDVDFGSNKITYSNVYSTEGDLPSASTYHGMFAHVHGTGKAYYAHAGAWVRLGNYDEITNAGTGNVTFSGTTIDSDDSSGIEFTPAITMASDLTVENDITVNNDINVKGSLNTVGSGTPEIFSDNEIELNAGTRIQATTGPFQMLKVTTTQRDALTASNGDIIYNTTDNKFQGYENGAWANLI